MYRVRAEKQNPLLYWMRLIDATLQSFHYLIRAARFFTEEIRHLIKSKPRGRKRLTEATSGDDGGAASGSPPQMVMAAAVRSAQRASAESFCRRIQVSLNANRRGMSGVRKGERSKR